VRFELKVQVAGLDHGQTNNRVERLHGSIKKRVRPMGAFRSRRGTETFARGYRIFHNYIKPHRTLAGGKPRNDRERAMGVSMGRDCRPFHVVIGVFFVFAINGVVP